MNLGERILGLGKAALARRDVTDLLPEWQEALGGEKVFVRDWTGQEKDQYDAERVLLSYDGDGNLQRTVNSRNLLARRVAIVLVDAQGERLFADAAKLGEVASGEVLARLMTVATEISGEVAGRVPLKDRPFGSSSTPSPNGSAGDPSAGGSAGSTAPS